MEKYSEKSKWNTMTTSAKNIFRPHRAGMSKVDTAPTRMDKYASLNSGSGMLMPGSEMTPNQLACSSINDHFKGSQVLGEREILVTDFEVTDTIRNPSITMIRGDRKRTLMRYVAAVEELKAALKLRRSGWETFEFPEFDGIPESDGSLALLQEAIEEKLNSCDEIEDQSIWQKGKMLAERLFVALSPFAKNFLTVAQGASQSVHPGCFTSVLTAV
jgi:hypothetical protein